MARGYYRIMLGKKSVYAQECFDGGFIGADFGIADDLTDRLPDEWRTFNKEFIPIYLSVHPDKKPIGAGLACGALWTISKGIQEGDLVLSPDGQGTYRVGRVNSGYIFEPGGDLPHRRNVEWLDVTIPRGSMSSPLKNSSGSVGTVSDLTKHVVELEQLIGGGAPAPVADLIASDPDVEDPLAFALEKHLEDFLVMNWSQTALGKEFAIFEEDGEIVGQQYATDAGPIDILAVSKDNKRILVVELKRGRTSDVVVGQTLRYMGYLKEQVATPDQTVEGIIIALEDDQRLHWALAAVPNVTFYRYRIDFQLIPN